MKIRALLEHRLAPVIAMGAIVLLLPLFFPSAYYYRVAALVFIFALAAIGLNLLMGFAGQVSLGHAGFMGIGAYTVAIGPAHLGLPSWLSFAAGAALSALGLRPGQVVMVHSSFDRFAGFTGKPSEVIQALEDAVGPEGTLLMPTLPFTGEHPWIPYAGGGFLVGALGLGFLAYRGGFRFGFRRS